MAQAQSTKSARKSPARHGSENLENEIGALSGLDASALKQKWLALFEADPPPGLGRPFMIRAVAYRLQEKAFGGVKASTERLFERVREDGKSALERIPKRRPSAGTVLIREWRGASHRVIVLDHEVVYQGRRYKSLSEVARVITGTHWSGPLFFGLKGRGKEVVHG